MATLVNLQVPDRKRRCLDTPRSLLRSVMPGKSKDVGFLLRNIVLHKHMGSVVGFVKLEMGNVHLCSGCKGSVTYVGTESRSLKEAGLTAECSLETQESFQRKIKDGAGDDDCDGRPRRSTTVVDVSNATSNETGRIHPKPCEIATSVVPFMPTLSRDYLGRRHINGERRWVVPVKQSWTRKTLREHAKRSCD